MDSWTDELIWVGLGNLQFLQVNPTLVESYVETKKILNKVLSTYELQKEKTSNVMLAAAGLYQT